MSRRRTTWINCRIAPELKTELTTLARELSVSVSELIRAGIAAVRKASTKPGLAIKLYEETLDPVYDKMFRKVKEDAGR